MEGEGLMGTLLQPRTQLGAVSEARVPRRRHTRGGAIELLRSVDAQGPQRRLAEAYGAHAAAGILPARRHYALKRLLDLSLAAPALLLTLPLYPLITLAIRLESPGPGLYRQVRVGKDGRPYVAFKFRTMRHVPPEQARAAHLEIVAKWMAGTPLVVYADSPGAPSEADAVASTEADVSESGQLAAASSLALAGAQSEGTVSAASVTVRARRRRKGPVVVAASLMPFKHTCDPRITRLGRILRKLSIDELPQLINVVRGEMSLVGPRPPVAYEVERYSERALARLRVLPGITGQWQVDGRGQVSFDEMVEMDLHHVAHSSLRRDVALLLRTVPAVLRCRGGG